MIPNIQELDQGLEEFGDLMECDEVIIFERATFLVISSYERVAHNDSKRKEKISNIMKSFKLSCRLVCLYTVLGINQKTVLIYHNFIYCKDLFNNNPKFNVPYSIYLFPQCLI